MKYIIMAVLVFGLGAVVYFFGGGDGVDEDLEKRIVESINWEKNYDSKSRHPYGTYLLHEVLATGLKGHELKDIDVSVQEYFDSSEIQIQAPQITYMYIGKSLNLYNEEVGDLLQFVSEGNNMFVAAEHLPVKLLEELFYNYNNYNYFSHKEDTAITLSFEHSDFGNEYRLENIEKDKAKTRRWRHLNYGLDYKYNGSSIGSIFYRPCFMKFEYGSGTILIHIVPQAFSNKFLSSDAGKEYAEIALSYFPNSTILFDNYTQYAYDDGLMEIDYSNDNSYSSNGRGLDGFDSLKFLLTQTSLRWAYFLILAAIVLFVIFKGKREQKIIPTMQSNDNSSLEFTETIARLYLSQNQHNKLIVHMETIFKNKMKAKYYIAYSDDESYARRIARKSGVDQKEITHLLNLFKGGSNITAVSDEYLINLYKKLNDFYKKAK